MLHWHWAAICESLGQVGIFLGGLAGTFAVVKGNIHISWGSRKHIEPIRHALLMYAIDQLVYHGGSQTYDQIIRDTDRFAKRLYGEDT